ncbi:S24 family peptidase [Bacteroides thetaiotaomicron]|jgi:phage repressor protein C with HTH and peptisase S24 domain|nr:MULTISPECIES: S24 family peptidase [Bacteroidales]MCS2244522.1 S24 family peptidase [Bacteroides thetaiotaomicron]MCS2910036.1 S24 family peptidase [Bacteroides thetaiotaomicron]MDC2097423.1 S24 family peptidase [Bacteroides thetaiotaomicron]MDC2117833.1 S24 family peptidase [Bacteroides thetaiotaomicron]MDC2118541.1 S24 family peptidase [Bacteroides thetaiotaomicron]
MTLKERMFYLIEKEGINPNQFYTKSGLGNGYLDKVGDSFRKPTIEKIRKSFPHWNIDWILSEKGEPISVSTSKNIDVLEAIPINQNYIINVPLVNQYAQAGYLCGYEDAAYMATLPTIPFIVDHEAQGNYVAFEVKGDSMNDGTEDSYLEGDRLLCREIQSHLWVTSKLHIRKWDFVIVHQEGILVKRIIDHNVDSHTITIHSLNDMYPDRVIDLAEVKQIFNVIELQRPRRR